MPDIAERVHDLEGLMAQVAHAQFKTETALTRLGNEMREFKDEMRQDRRQLNKARGDLANKMGTVAEDILAPNTRRLATEEFGFSRIDDFLVRAGRRNRRGADRQAEFDVVCSGPERIVVAESKSSPSIEAVEAFAERLRSFFDFYPEYEGRGLAGVFSSWSLDGDLCRRISALRLFGLPMSDETMAIVARPAGPSA